MIEDDRVSRGGECKNVKKPTTQDEKKASLIPKLLQQLAKR